MYFDDIDTEAAWEAAVRELFDRLELEPGRLVVHFCPNCLEMIRTRPGIFPFCLDCDLPYRVIHAG